MPSSLQEITLLGIVFGIFINLLAGLLKWGYLVWATRLFTWLNRYRLVRSKTARRHLDQLIRDQEYRHRERYRALRRLGGGGMLVLGGLNAIQSGFIASRESRELLPFEIVCWTGGGVALMLGLYILKDYALILDSLVRAERRVFRRHRETPLHEELHSHDNTNSVTAGSNTPK